MTISTAMNINELTLLLPGSYRDSKHKLSAALQRTTKEVTMKVRGLTDWPEKTGSRVNHPTRSLRDPSGTPEPGMAAAGGQRRRKSAYLTFKYL